MKLNHKAILDILATQESLSSPDWMWRERVGGDFYAGHWCCGCKLDGIDLHFPNRITGVLNRVIACPPKDDPFYEYAGEGEDRTLYMVESFDERGERQLLPIAREKLLVHRLSFKVFAERVALLCRESKRSCQVRELLPDTLAQLFESDLSAYFAFVFDTPTLLECARRIRQHQPNDSFILFTMGRRCATDEVRQHIRSEFDGFLVVFPEVAVSTATGFAWLPGITWKNIRNPRRPASDIPENLRWEDITVAISDEGDISFSIIASDKNERIICSFNYREEDKLFSKTRHARGGDSRKPAYKLLYLLINTPDQQVLSEELLNNAGIKVVDARKDLKAVLKKHLPQVFESGGDPFKTHRGGEKPGVHRLFGVKPCAEYIRSVELKMAAEHEERETEML